MTPRYYSPTETNLFFTVLVFFVFFLVWCVQFFIGKFHKNRCTERTTGTVLSVMNYVHMARQRNGAADFLISYKAQGKEYQKWLRLSSRGVKNLCDIAEPTIEIYYNPKNPMEIWIDEYEKKRLGGI